MNQSKTPAGLRSAKLAPLDMKLEVVAIPVSDVDRARLFYESLGWRLDADISHGAEYRVVQFTPPGSACSVHFGVGVTTGAPGSAQGLYLVVADIEATVATLRRLSVPVSAIVHREGPGRPAREGRHPQQESYSSFASFTDPDGNHWLLQEITRRLPGRTTPLRGPFDAAAALAEALRRAAAAHGEYEKQTGTSDESWPEWYAEYMLREYPNEQGRD